MYFKIFFTLLILFVSINLLSDLYNFYNTGAWEPFSATMEDNTKISKSLAFGIGDYLSDEFKKNPVMNRDEIMAKINKQNFGQLQQQFQPNMDEKTKEKINGMFDHYKDKPGLAIVMIQSPRMGLIPPGASLDWFIGFFIKKIEDKLNSHFQTKDNVSKSDLINIGYDIFLLPRDKAKELAEKIYNDSPDKGGMGGKSQTKKFFEDLVIPAGPGKTMKLNLDKQSSPQSQQQPSSSMWSSEKSPQNNAVGWKQVGLEGEKVKCSGLLRYGANNEWVAKHSMGSLECSNEVFGNHLPGVNKTCECKMDNWADETRTESVTQKIFTKESDLCVDSGKGGYVNYTGKTCGKNNNQIQWTKIHTPADQARGEFNKKGCDFELQRDTELVSFENPSTRRNNLIKTNITLPFNWKCEFKYTPTKIQSKSTNIFRLTDGIPRTTDSYKDRLFFVFKQGGKTDLEIGIGTKNGNVIWHTNENFQKDKTYNIRIEIRNTEAKTFIDNKLTHTKTITAKRDIIPGCKLFMSDKWYDAALCVIEDYKLSSLGSDDIWTKKYVGNCGERPTINGGEILQTTISELLRYDIGSNSQSVEWEKIGREKNKVHHIPQPNPITKLNSDYLPFIDDDNRDWVPENIDLINPSETSNIHLGKYFTKKVSNLKGFKLPNIYDSEYELIGGLVTRAEKAQRRGATEKEMIEHKKKIVKIFDELMGFETDSYTQINNKKQQKQYSGVPAYTQPDQSSKQQTNNMFADNSNSNQKAKDMKGRYTNKYRPKDPREYPRPMDAMWSLLSNR